MVMQHAVEARSALTEEEKRVAVVHRLRQLDTSPQERFDRITRLACATFGVPVAEINFLDAYRQFTKSPQREGTSPNTPREDAFCDVTIQQPGILVVPDATKDPRFSWKATVTGDRRIRFYAGVPLQIAGYGVGTLCLVDSTPREFDDVDRAQLERMAAWVEGVLTDSMDIRGARRIQRSLLPVAPDDIGTLQVAGLSHPSADLSGELYDWSTVGEQFTFSVVNVFETGAAAALIAASIRAALQAHRHLDTLEAITEVDGQLAEDLSASATLAAVFHGRLDTRTGTLEYVGAGHGLAVVARASGEVQALPRTGLPLGMGRQSGWTKTRVRLAPGDCLIASTDGVLELFDDSAAAAVDLASFASPRGDAQQIVDRIRHALVTRTISAQATAAVVTLAGD